MSIFNNVLIPKEIQMQRLKLCMECPKTFLNFMGAMTCRECGCVIKMKIVAPLQSCPLKKW